MSITGELRKWNDETTILPITRRQLLDAIADRIDAEHEKAIRELNDYASASILLPKDADGETIHIGDVMECDKLPNGKRVCGEVNAISNDCVWLINVQYKIHAEYLHHHHEPTVEDVLREFGDWYAHTKGGCDEDGIIAEYASKLQLRGDGE